MILFKIIFYVLAVVLFLGMLSTFLNCSLGTREVKDKISDVLVGMTLFLIYIFLVYEYQVYFGG